MKFSQAFKEDPTRTKKDIGRFEKALLGLIEEYRKGALAKLKTLLPTINTFQHRAKTPIEDYPAYLEELSGGTSSAATPIIKREVEKQFMKGLLFATIAITRAGMDIPPPTLTPKDWETIDVIRVRDLSALKGITEEMNKKIVSTLTEGLIQGDTFDELEARLNREVDGIGVNRARLMARTETMFAVNQGTLQRYGQWGISRVEWVAAPEDGRVCPECKDLDGQVFDIEDVPPLPFHPGCRCTTVPVLSPEET